MKTQTVASYFRFTGGYSTRCWIGNTYRCVPSGGCTSDTQKVTNDLHMTPDDTVQETD